MTANNLFGGLGNLGGLGDLVGGLSEMMPQDDPNVKMFAAQQELANLQKQEDEVFIEIGKKAFVQYGETAFPIEANKLGLLKSNIQAAQENLSMLQTAAQAAEVAQREVQAALTCPQCAKVNPQGVNFCQECGTKLGAPAKATCPQCGTENPAGTRFCGSCGARIGE